MIHQFTHIIHNLLVVPTYEKCSIYDAEQCNNHISLLVNMKLQNRLESLFDRIVPHNMILSVDTLSIDFGEIEMEEMNSVFVDKVINLIEIELKKLLKDKLVENLNSEKTLYIEVSNNSVYYYEKQLKFENKIDRKLSQIIDSELRYINQESENSTINVIKLDDEKIELEQNLLFHPHKIERIKLSDLNFVLHFLRYGTYPSGIITSPDFDIRKVIKNIVDFYPLQFIDSLLNIENQNNVINRLNEIDLLFLKQINEIQHFQLLKIQFDEALNDNLFDTYHGKNSNSIEKYQLSLLYFLKFGVIPWWESSSNLKDLLAKVFEEGSAINLFDYSSQFRSNVIQIIDASSNEIVKIIVSQKFNSFSVEINSHRQLLATWMEENHIQLIHFDNYGKQSWYIILQYLIDAKSFDRDDFILFTIKEIGLLNNLTKQENVASLIEVGKKSEYSLIKEWSNYIQLKFLIVDGNVAEINDNELFVSQIAEAIAQRKISDFYFREVENEDSKKEIFLQYFEKFNIFNKILLSETINKFEIEKIHNDIILDIVDFLKKQDFSIDTNFINALLNPDNKQFIKSTFNIDNYQHLETIIKNDFQENLELQDEILINKYQNITRKIEESFEYNKMINNDLSEQKFLLTKEFKEVVIDTYLKEELIFLEETSKRKISDVENYNYQLELFVKYFLNFKEAPWWNPNFKNRDLDSILVDLMRIGKTQSYEFLKNLYYNTENKVIFLENLIQYASDSVRYQLIRDANLSILDGISFVFQIDEQLKTNSWAKIFEVLFEKSIFDNQLFISSWISKQDAQFLELVQPIFENSIYIQVFKDFQQKEQGLVESLDIANVSQEHIEIISLNEIEISADDLIELFIIFIQKGFIPIEKYMLNLPDFELGIKKAILLKPDKFKSSIQKVGKHVLAEILPFQYFSADFQLFILQILAPSKYQQLIFWVSYFRKDNLIETSIIDTFLFDYVRNLDTENFTLEKVTKDLLRFSIRAKKLQAAEMIRILVNYFSQSKSNSDIDIILDCLQNIDNQLVKTPISVLDAQENVKQKELDFTKPIFVRNAGLVL
ncbi:MAG: hypothetical protein IPL95_09640 [Saprospiraceae bacterium]|nr:hypothetical protein [Saprospiraceae bacterium]